MRIKILLISLLVLLLPLVAAERVGMVVSFPDGSVHGQCVNVAENANGYDTVRGLSIPMAWSARGTYGRGLCQVNGVGDEVDGDACSYSGKYWGFFQGDTDWNYLPVGFDGGSDCWNGDPGSYDGHYCARDGDLLGFRYGEFGDMPTFYSFDKVCNPLEVNDIKVYVDGKKQSADETGGRIKAPPEAEISFKIKLENNYLFDEELEIEDIAAEIVLKDIDDGDDIEEDIDFDTLEVGDDAEEEIQFTLPLFVKDDDYKLELTLTAETSTGIKQEVKIDYKLSIDKERHDVYFSRTTLENEESCPNEQNSVNVEVTNIGKSDEEDILLKVKNDQLGLDFSQTFDLDEGDDRDDVTFRKTIEFTVPDIQPGQYSLDLTLDFAEQVRENVVLKVKDCLPSNLVTGNTFAVLADKPVQPPILAQKSVVTQVNQRSFIQVYAVPILLGVFLLFLTLLILFIAVILKK
jgi:hypothetical protein